ncbi:tripartite tricarboxylate transporter permease [Thermococcus aggregans]|uniref:Tripartite tricarboxylate transporter permease n=1 Tax=Thermococcus aggregans TaxID=110163 RepID=A0A9E7MYL8_THEAG|nr:tripartite tricarboxylate transporter permease [Thermococcus aggregans]USS41280.1 tripartite tricarboxylate transporter permease [Thermococcus aggregans]
MLKWVLLGILFGTVTGITPALHVNTLASIVETLLTSPGGFSYVMLLYSMGLTHTFLDAFPSTFFGIPEEETAVSILPAHKLALHGQGLEVINISLKASLLAVVFAIPLAFPYVVLAEHYTSAFGKVAVFVLAFLLIITEKGVKRIYALLIFLISGIFGLVVDRLPLKEPYFHVFVGLFGVSAIVFSLKNNQKIEIGNADIQMSKRRFLKFSFIGTCFGMLASLLPTFTSSQAALLGSFFSKDERTFLTIAFSVNTSNFVFSLVNFYATGKTRNGILVLIKDLYYPLSSKELIILLLVTIITSSIINLYGLSLSTIIGKAISKIDYTKLNLGILLFIATASLYFDGILGLGVLLTAATIGISTSILKVKRTTCMGVLMLKIMITNNS